MFIDLYEKLHHAPSYIEKPPIQFLEICVCTEWAETIFLYFFLLFILVYFFSF